MHGSDNSRDIYDKLHAGKANAPTLVKVYKISQEGSEVRVNSSQFYLSVVFLVQITALAHVKSKHSNETTCALLRLPRLMKPDLIPIRT